MSWLGGPLPERYVDYDVYTDDELYQPDYLPDGTYSEWDSGSDTTTYGTIGDANWTQDFMDNFKIGGRGGGTQGTVAPSPMGPRPSFAPVSFGDMSFTPGSTDSAKGFSKIGNAFISSGAEEAVTQGILKQMFTPLQIQHSNQEYGPVLAEAGGDDDDGGGSWLGAIGRAVLPIAANAFLKNFIT